MKVVLFFKPHHHAILLTTPTHAHHSILTFVRTIFPGVWEESVMRHGGQASDEIEDDLYQYNII